MARMDFRNPRIWIPTTGGLLLLVLVVLRLIQASSPVVAAPTVEEIRQESGVPVTVAAVTVGEFDVWRAFNGSVSGVRDAVIRARTSDQVASVLVAVGDRVRQGQTVVRQAGETAEARMRQAEAAMQQAQRTVDRLRPLHEAGAISEQEFDQALTQLQLATQDVAAAQDDLALASPLAGTVTDVPARPGMIPTAGDPLVRVADLSQLVVRLQVGAREAAEIQEGQPARVQSDGAEGQVRRVALQADPESRLVEVEVAFPPGTRLIPGTLSTVEVRVASREDAVQVPRSAVRDGSVWVIGEDGRATRRAVVVGLEARDQVEIVSGLEPGEQVVVQGASLLNEGARVRTVGGTAGGDDV